MDHEHDISVSFAACDPQSPAAITAMTAYFDELDARFIDGFDPGVTLTAHAGQFREPSGRFILGRSGDEVVSCGGVYELEPTVIEIKRMWVAPVARGKGVGAATLAHLETAALELGGTTVYLDTNGVLHEAIALYTSRGYLSIESYNDNPYAQRWFAKELTPTQ